MKEKYLKPEIEVIQFEINSLILASGGLLDEASGCGDAI